MDLTPEQAELYALALLEHPADADALRAALDAGTLFDDDLTAPDDDEPAPPPELEGEA